MVLAFALAMAYVEAAAVLYLRTLYGGIDPVGPRAAPFETHASLLWVELGREAATMVMLATVGWLAGRGAIGRFGAFLAAFGAWDIGYYLFLRLLTGWPPSFLAPDILFLIPLPWWGPVGAPMLIAALMVAEGGLAMARELGDGMPWPDASAWGLMVGGVLLCLSAFMWEALLILPREGLQAAFALRPEEGLQFPWGLYAAGVAVSTAGAWRTLTAVRGPFQEAPDAAT